MCSLVLLFRMCRRQPQWILLEGTKGVEEEEEEEEEESLFKAHAVNE